MGYGARPEVVVRWVMALVLGGCAGAADTDPVDDDGACGDVTSADVSLRALVVESDGVTPVSGATVELVEHAWTSGDAFGSGTTGGDGVAEFAAIGVIGVDDCWGTALDYELVATEGDREGSLQVNSVLYASFVDGSIADFTEDPIALSGSGQ